MEKFIKYIISLCLLSAITLCIIYFIIDIMGLSDWAYKRFTTPKQKSLIIGTSRAAQGIQPHIINEYFKDNEFDLPIYNFSFTGSTSPFGNTYMEKIKKKLQPNDKHNALFVISVEPWSLSLFKELDTKELRENVGCLGCTHYVNKKPNFEYLIDNFRLTKIFEWRRNAMAHLNDDGWYQVDFNMDSTKVIKNIKAKMADYNGYHISKSDYRINSLIEAIEYLKQYGSVYMVRVPVCEEMFLLEDTHWPNFDSDMLNIANNESIPYFSFRNDYKRFRTTDGNHLYKDDGAIFTRDLCDSIKLYNAHDSLGLLKK